MKLQSADSPKSHDQVSSIVTRLHGESDRSSLGSAICIDEEEFVHTVLTGALPQRNLEAGVLMETIRDPENPSKLAFLRWKNENANVVRDIRHEGRIYVPPDPTSNSFPDLSLPDRLLPCGAPAELFDEISSTISRFVKLLPDQLRIVTAYTMASWYPDCFEAAPYLWLVGPLGSGKTKLLKLLWCLCRRGLIVGDLRGGSIYKLVDTWNPTLLIDELDLGNSRANDELLRMLRTGSVPGVPTVRNGLQFSTYGLKVISSRQPLGDAALASRGLVISMLPSDCETQRLDEPAMRELENRFQPRLCMLRLKNYVAVKNPCVSPIDWKDVSHRGRQIARALTAPLLGDAEHTSALLTILGEHDDEAQIERSLEPEWLVAETLLSLCHEGLDSGRLVSEILVGGVAAQVNQKLELQGEQIRLTSKKVGLVLTSLGVRVERLGRMGRGLRFTSIQKLKIHATAARLGIDRRAIASLAALESGFAEPACGDCEKLGLTGGLRFVNIDTRRPRIHNPSGRGPLFDHRDDDDEK